MKFSIPFTVLDFLEWTFAIITVFVAMSFVAFCVVMAKDKTGMWP